MLSVSCSLFAYLLVLYDLTRFDRAMWMIAHGVLGNLANVYGTYLYPKSHGPRYIPGSAAVVGFCFVVGGLAYVLRM